MPSCLPKTTGKVPGAHHSRDGGPYTCTASDCPQAPTTSQGVPPISRPVSPHHLPPRLCDSPVHVGLHPHTQQRTPSQPLLLCTHPMSIQDQTRITAWSRTASPPEARASESSSAVWPANATLPAGVQGYRTGSCSFLMPLAAALLWGTSPLFLLCPSLAGPASLQAGLSSHTRERPCVITSFTPGFPSGGASPHMVWASSLPSLRGESGQTFGNSCPPLP